MIRLGIVLSFIVFNQCTYAQTSADAVSTKDAVSRNDAVSQAATLSEIEEIIVTSHLLSKGGAAQSLSIISGDNLAEKVAGSLGETVANEPGIHTASFGAAVGRPVIHGLSGARVKTTEDRIDSLDVATASADHAVTVEPFIANQITILKGPSTLLYGSAAIGGVVDVETGRIAKQMPDEIIQGRAELRFSDNANAKTAAVRLDGRASNNLAWHLDAFSKQADDYDIPGFAESAAQRASEADNGESFEEAQGRLESSFYDSQGVAMGASLILERGYVGASISAIDSVYGLVGAHHDEAEPVTSQSALDISEPEPAAGQVEMEQTRVDVEAQLNDVSALLETINLRFGINNYQHQEIEGNEVGTLFENDAWEGRLEFKHAQVAGFSGTFGAQLSAREYSALGAEAFVAPVDSNTQSLFWVGERNFEGFDLETGFRVERVEHDSEIVDQDSLSFAAQSFSVGAVIPINQAITVSTLFDYSKRAPTIEELFSNGPHLATQSYEIGDIGLREETAQALSFTANYQSTLIDLNVTAYLMEFSDFIYQAADGSEVDDLPVFVYQQDNARFIGLDFEAAIHLAQLLRGDVDLTLLYDTVDAELEVSGNQNLPRIPAARYGLGLKWHHRDWSLKLDWQRVGQQTQVADFEFATQAYNDISLRLNRRIELGNSELNVFLHGKNLSNHEQRHHASFVKDFAPAPGRRIEAGVRLLF